MIEKWFDDQEFKGINYTGQKLTQTEFDHCSFLDCDFSDADLSESDLANCTFENCNFSNAKLAGAGMKDVRFIVCKLIGMNFHACSNFLFSASFRKCILDYSIFQEKKLKKIQFSECSLKDVDFSGADLMLAVFHNCDLQRAVFHQCNLEGVDFRSAINYSIDPEQNKIKKAKFSYSGISGLLEKYNIEIGE